MNQVLEKYYKKQILESLRPSIFEKIVFNGKSIIAYEKAIDEAIENMDSIDWDSIFKSIPVNEDFA